MYYNLVKQDFNEICIYRLQLVQSIDILLCTQKEKELHMVMPHQHQDGVLSLFLMPLMFLRLLIHKVGCETKFLFVRAFLWKDLYQHIYDPNIVNVNSLLKQTKFGVSFGSASYAEVL